MSEYLECPKCRQPVTSLPGRPAKDTDDGELLYDCDGDDLRWFTGDRCTCQCGAALVVEVEDGTAWLVEPGAPVLVEDEPPKVERGVLWWSR